MDWSKDPSSLQRTLKDALLFRGAAFALDICRKIRGEKWGEDEISSAEKKKKKLPHIFWGKREKIVQRDGNAFCNQLVGNRFNVSFLCCEFDLISFNQSHELLIFSVGILINE